MAIQIHIRVKESDWDSEHELAELIAEVINTYTSEHMINVPVLVLPVEDPENEMEDLKVDFYEEKDDESKYLEARNRADRAEQTTW